MIPGFSHPALPDGESFPRANLGAVALESVKRGRILATQFSNVVKGLAVNDAWTETTDRGLMGGSGIPLVVRKAIAGIRSVEVTHQPVTINLRNDGSGCNRKIDPISFVEAVLRLREIRNCPAVDKDV